MIQQAADSGRGALMVIPRRAPGGDERPWDWALPRGWPGPSGNWGVSPERSRDSSHGQDTRWEEAVALFQASSFSVKMVVVVV